MIGKTEWRQQLRLERAVYERFNWDTSVCREARSDVEWNFMFWTTQQTIWTVQDGGISWSTCCTNRISFSHMYPEWSDHTSYPFFSAPYLQFRAWRPLNASRPGQGVPRNLQPSLPQASAESKRVLCNRPWPQAGLADWRWEPFRLLSKGNNCWYRC